ncbi:hypothetical protein [Micromonospora echinospora]|uniref:hypothetical protein n=1 Tax=Micromonospora echinospora TaxID=1877 RepID=UPI000B5AE388|nr:hypothetical protein [Micromonospora echinospora]
MQQHDPAFGDGPSQVVVTGAGDVGRKVAVVAIDGVDGGFDAQIQRIDLLHQRRLSVVAKVQQAPRRH